MLLLAVLLGATQASADVRVLASSVAPLAAHVVAAERVADAEHVGPLLVLLEPNGPADARSAAALYGASPQRYAQVRAWLLGMGFRVRRESAHRTSITVDGPAAAVRAAFGTQLVRGRLGHRTVHVAAQPPRVPADLGIRGVIGLDDLPRFRPLHRPAALVGPGATALDATDLALVYRSAPLLAAGHRGGGATIAVLARSNYDDGDLAAFAERFTTIAPRAPVRVFATPGVDPGIGAAEDELEVLLDLQWAGAAAPEALVHAVIASPAADIPEALEVAVEQRLGDVISISYGLCEPAAGIILTEFLHDLYARAVLQGQTVVVASGDAGATDCAPVSPVVAVNALASSPHVVAVGGTALDPLFDEAGRATGRGGEWAWQDEFGAGGGGVSALFGPPGFQAGLGFRAGRALPDLALAASPTMPGYAMVRGGDSLAIGGTSAGAPVMAGFLALAIGMRGETLGSVLPSLYEIAALDSSSATGAFHDVLDGTNGFPAASGFDLATGWGTPVAERLVPALAHAAPPACEPAFACSVPGAPAADGCLLEWRLPGVTLAATAKGLPKNRQRCRDGEACDLDGLVNKSCTIAAALCVNVVDPRLRTRRDERACAPRPLNALRIARPRAASGPAGAANRARLETSLASLPPSPIAVRESCTDTIPIEVPVPIGSSFGEMTLRAAATQQQRGVRAKVTLVCERTL